MRPRLKGALEGERRPGRGQAGAARSQGPIALAPSSPSSFSSCTVWRGTEAGGAAP